MKLTKSELRQIVKEELGRIKESTDRARKEVLKGVRSVLGRNADWIAEIGDDIHLYGMEDSDTHIAVSFEDGSYYLGVTDDSADWKEMSDEISLKDISKESAKLAKKYKRQLT